MATAKMIRTARQKSGENQIQFGKHFGVDQPTISRWETEGPPAKGPSAMLIKQYFNGHGRPKRRSARKEG